MLQSTAITRFFQEELPAKLQALSPNQQPLWGKMNAHQMLEHLSMAFLMSTGKIKVPLTSPADKLPILKRVLLSEKELPKNFQNPVLPEQPVPVGTATQREAIQGLQQCIADFFAFYEANPEATAMHNVYGELNFDEWLVMHKKHITHHLAQFGLTV